MDETTAPTSEEDVKTISQENEKYLNMSDEEFENLTDDDYDNATIEETDTETVVEEDDITEEETASEETDSIEEIEEKATDSNPEESSNIESQEDIENTDKEKEDINSDKDTSDSIDYKAEYEKLTKPFKANGRMIDPKTVEDRITLMQKGANYSLRMAGIKPIRAVQKSLEEAGIINDNIIDTDKFNKLMDLNNGKPEAIEAFLKEHNIDPLDLNTEDNKEYTPDNYIATEESVLLDDVVKELEGDEHFPKTLNILAKQWDDNSREHFLKNPEDIKTLNMDVAEGTFDIINNHIQNERMYGRLKGLSDFEAYLQLAQVSKANTVGKQDKTPVPDTKPSKPDKSQRKAAGITKTRSTAKKKIISPLALSDEEFERLYGDEDIY